MLFRSTRNPAEVQGWSFDAVVVGSDTVWDTSIFGFDPLYFGQLPAPKVVAYAASCGKQVWSDSPPPAEVVEGLRTFSSIAVRDERTAELVHHATGTCPPCVVDPVFLPSDRAAFVGRPVSTPERYMLVYGARYTEADGAFIRSFAARHGCDIYAVGHRNLWAPHSVMHVSPLEITTWFERAEYVFSSTFHGVVLAVRCGKPFVAKLHAGNINKSGSLLTMLGLRNRAAEQLDKLTDVVSMPVDYEAVNQRLKTERRSSLSFLEQAMRT